MKKLEFPLALAMVATLSACSLAPAYKAPATPTAAAFREMGPWVSAQPNDQLPRDDWWHLYGDAELDRLQPRLLANNADLAAALQLLKAGQRLGERNRAAPVQEIKVDPVSGEAPEAALACGHDAGARGVARVRPRWHEPHPGRRRGADAWPLAAARRHRRGRRSQRSVAVTAV